MIKSVLFYILILASLSAFSNEKVDPSCGEKIIGGLTDVEIEDYDSINFQLISKQVSPTNSFDKIVSDVHLALAKKFLGYKKRHDFIDGMYIELRDEIDFYDEIPLHSNDDFRPFSLAGYNGHDKMIKRFREADSRFQTAYIDVYNKLNNEDFVRKYLKDLHTEAFLWQSKTNHKDKYAEHINQGRVHRQAVKAVILQRLKLKGETGFTVIRGGFQTEFNEIKGVKGLTENDMALMENNDVFRLAVGNGPFIDKTFDEEMAFGHGAFSHLMQRDMVHNTILESYGKDYPEFYKYLGTKKGITFWIDLFDSDISRSLTSPERTSEFLYRSMLKEQD